jgi:hypothetical protein
MSAYTDADVQAVWNAMVSVAIDHDSGWVGGYRDDLVTAVLDAVAPAIEVRTLREAAESARAYSKDNNNKLLSRVTMRATADWLDARADLLEKRATP